MNESWIQIMSLFLANAGLIIWFRSESRSDWRHMDAKLDAIHEEMKNFTYNALAGLIYAAPLVWIILFEVGYCFPSSKT